jgi:hypothetical protein
LFSGLENLITLSVILRYLEAKLSILRWSKMLKTSSGGKFHFKKTPISPTNVFLAETLLPG